MAPRVVEEELYLDPLHLIGMSIWIWSIMVSKITFLCILLVFSLFSKTISGPFPPHHLPPSHGPPPPPDMFPPPGPGGHGPPPPNHPPNEGDSTNVSALLSKLVNAGLIGDKGSDNPPAAAVPGPGSIPGPGPVTGPGSNLESGAPGTRVTPPRMLRQTPPPPISVPHLGLTPATLKQ